MQFWLFLFSIKNISHFPMSLNHLWKHDSKRLNIIIWLHNLFHSWIMSLFTQVTQKFSYYKPHDDQFLYVHFWIYSYYFFNVKWCKERGKMFLRQLCYIHVHDLFFSGSWLLRYPSSPLSRQIINPNQFLPHLKIACFQKVLSEKSHISFQRKA